MGWLLEALRRRPAVRHYTIATITAMSIELLIICGQAMRGRPSHFNVSTSKDALLFETMGIAITAFTVWTAVIAWQFFRYPKPGLPRAFIWGIRLGMLCFIVFAFEGGLMGALLRHTVGGEDGAGGLLLLNWSTKHGDLRIAHFFGLHGLQVLPLAGWLCGERKKVLFVFAALYISGVVALLLNALRGLPPF